MTLDLLTWLRDECREYRFDVHALYREGGQHDWPITAHDAEDLLTQLEEGGHFLPLPKEPAALANVVEVSIVDFIIERAERTVGLVVARGTERGYPDLEFSGPSLGNGKFVAVDVKAARRAASGRRTQSRITLYTGNTYFRYPKLHWPGTFRPFEDYARHLSVVCVYTLDEFRLARIRDLEVIAHETWRLGSKKRSSTTREYIGAVERLDALRAGEGEFETPDAFYAYWRRFPFKIGRVVQQQLDKLLAAQ